MGIDFLVEFTAIPKRDYHLQLISRRNGGGSTAGMRVAGQWKLNRAWISYEESRQIPGAHKGLHGKKEDLQCS